jgi:hypothetical protein
MKILHTLAVAASLAALMVVPSSALAQRSATWKASGMPNTTTPASNFVGRRDPATFAAPTRTVAPSTAVARSYAPAPTYAYVQPQYVAPQVAVAPGMEDRRVFSYAPQGYAPQGYVQQPQQYYYYYPQQQPVYRQWWRPLGR